MTYCFVNCPLVILVLVTSKLSVFGASDKMHPVIATFVGNRCNADLHPGTMHLWAIYTLLSFNPQNNTFCLQWSV